MSRINAIFFDLDGTLTDPKVGITRCIQHALGELGATQPDADELTWCIGPPLLESFKSMVGNALDTLYDTIGCDYADIRKPDPRIAKAILCALGNNESVVNVGAGAGSYEPLDRYVVAVEPSITMIAQRPPGSAPVVQASAVSLPFVNGSFDASLAILTVHHWPDQAQGLRELAACLARSGRRGDLGPHIAGILVDRLLSGDSGY